MSDLVNDWQMSSPGWRDYQIHKCLCNLKDLLGSAVLTDFYALNIQATQVNLSSATTYYFAGYGATQPSTTAALVPLIAPKEGVLTNVHLIFWVNGTLASAGSCSLWVRINNSDDYLVTDALSLTGVTNKVNVDTLTIPVNEDDEIEFKLLTATWVTPPTQVRIFGNIGISR